MILIAVIRENDLAKDLIIYSNTTTSFDTIKVYNYFDIVLIAFFNLLWLPCFNTVFKRLIKNYRFDRMISFYSIFHSSPFFHFSDRGRFLASKA